MDHICLMAFVKLRIRRKLVEQIQRQMVLGGHKLHTRTHHLIVQYSTVGAMFSLEAYTCFLDLNIRAV